MHQISAAQIKAARSLLGWSQGDVAAATGLSRATVRKVELGYAVRGSNISDICKALENNGIEFLDDDGVKRRPEGIKTYSGPYSCDKFFDDMIKSVKEKGGGVICHIQLPDMLTKLCGTAHCTVFDRLEQVQKLADVKCLLSETIVPPFALPSFEVRVISEIPAIMPFANFSYGNQWVYVYQDSNLQFVFVVIQKPHLAHNCENYFLPRWNIGQPLLPTARPKKLCA